MPSPQPKTNTKKPTAPFHSEKGKRIFAMPAFPVKPKLD